MAEKLFDSYPRLAIFSFPSQKRVGIFLILDPMEFIKWIKFICAFSTSFNYSLIASLIHLPKLITNRLQILNYNNKKIFSDKKYFRSNKEMLLGTRSTPFSISQTKSKPDWNTWPTPKHMIYCKGDKSKNSFSTSSTKKTKPSSFCIKSVRYLLIPDTRLGA